MSSGRSTQQEELQIREHVMRAGIIKRAKTEFLESPHGLPEIQQFLRLQKQFRDEMVRVFELRRQQLEMGRAA